MATERLTVHWCDVCFEATEIDNRVPATWTGPIGLGDELRDVDLCEQHEAAVIPTIRQVMAFGRKPEISPPVRRKPPTVGVPESLGLGDDEDCPGCGRPFKLQASLRKHVRERHPDLWAIRANGRGGDRDTRPLVCPNCQREFDGGAGLASHRRATHHINAPITASMRKSA